MEGYTYLQQICVCGVNTPLSVEEAGMFRDTVVTVDLIPDVLFTRSLTELNLNQEQAQVSSLAEI